MDRNEQTTSDFGAITLVDQLTDARVPVEQRLLAARQLFPEERKAEQLEHGARDIKARPVRYFRLMTCEELKTLLSRGSISSIDNPVIQESFDQQKDQIRNSLKNFLESEGLYGQYQGDFDDLAANFTLENYRNFVQKKLPLKELFKLHVSAEGGGGSYVGVTGLVSLSAGAPYQPPSERLVVVEMAIPQDQVYINPRTGALKEMEKEINTTDLKPEWIIDTYINDQDFAERFVKDPRSALYPEYEYQKSTGRYPVDYMALRDVWDVLQTWKVKEALVDLIPTSKVRDLDPNNPVLEKPLAA